MDYLTTNTKAKNIDPNASDQHQNNGTALPTKLYALISPEPKIKNNIGDC